MGDLFKTDINNLFSNNIKTMEKEVIGATLAFLTAPKSVEIVFKKYLLPHLEKISISDDFKPEFSHQKSYFNTNNETFNYNWTLPYPQVKFLEYRPRNFIYSYGSVDIKPLTDSIRIVFSKDLSIINPPTPLELKRMANEKRDSDLTFLNDTILLINNDFENHNKDLYQRIENTVSSRIEYLKNYANYNF